MKNISEEQMLKMCEGQKGCYFVGHKSMPKVELWFIWLFVFGIGCFFVWKFSEEKKILDLGIALWAFFMLYLCKDAGKYDDMMKNRKKLIVCKEGIWVWKADSLIEWSEIEETDIGIYSSHTCLRVSIVEPKGTKHYAFALKGKNLTDRKYDKRKLIEAVERFSGKQCADKSGIGSRTKEVFLQGGGKYDKSQAMWLEEIMPNYRI